MSPQGARILYFPSAGWGLCGFEAALRICKIGKTLRYHWGGKLHNSNRRHQRHDAHGEIVRLGQVDRFNLQRLTRGGHTRD